MGGNGVIVLWPMFSRKDFVVMSIDTSKSIAITKLLEQSGWNQICGLMFYSFMRIDDSPDTEPRKDDSSKFEDAIEPPEIVRESSWRDRFRCFRRNPRERGARSTERGRSRERSVRSSASQTPEPQRRTVGTSNRPTVRNAETDSRLARQRSARQRGVSSTNIERAPRRDAQTAPMRESWSPRNLSRQRNFWNRYSSNSEFKSAERRVSTGIS